MSQHAKEYPGRSEQTIRELVAGQLDTFDITTPATAGLELKIVHGLGRVPNGYIIVQRPYTGTATDHGMGATAWTKDFLYLKFEATSAALTLAVY